MHGRIVSVKISCTSLFVWQLFIFFVSDRGCVIFFVQNVYLIYHLSLTILMTALIVSCFLVSRSLFLYIAGTSCRAYVLQITNNVSTVWLLMFESLYHK